MSALIDSLLYTLIREEPAYVTKKLWVGEETLILLALRDYLKSHGFVMVKLKKLN